MISGKLFRKKNYARVQKKHTEERPGVPDGMVRKCDHCGALLFSEEIEAGACICSQCGHYFRMTAAERLRLVTDEGSFEPWFEEVTGGNPLETAGYEEKLADAKKSTGLSEAVSTGCALIGGSKAAVAVCDSRFMMASMGYAVGERLTRMIERATAEGLPVIIFTASGGARMQEGMISLMQMAKTSAALERHSAAGLLYISVLTDPTTGGVTASFAMLGDIILAESGALVGFAGRRVIEQTIREKLPENFQRAGFLLEHGFADAVLQRGELKKVLAWLLAAHSGAGVQRPADSGETGHGTLREAVDPGATGHGTLREAVDSGEAGHGILREAVDSGEAGHGTLQEARPLAAAGSLPGAGRKPDEGDGCPEDEAETPRIRGSAAPEGEEEAPCAPDPWQRVQRSRRPDRPTGTDFIRGLFDSFMEMHGDRTCGDDRSVIGGLALFHGQPVTVIAQAKGHGTREKVHRNFGMPMPEGYRKAARLLRQAEKFHRPVICFVDTPGAFCGAVAEERGQGQAIASDLSLMSGLQVPTLSVVLGEGGSGGALALAVANEVWMLENAVYSVLSPEGYASILWKDAGRASEAAAVMRMTARDLMSMDLIEQILPEPEDYDTAHMQPVLEAMDREIRRFLAEYGSLSGPALADLRYRRFRRY